MKTKFLMATLILLAQMQLACSDGDKEKAVKYCSENSEDCVNKYYQIAGAAAAKGESQVAEADSTVEEGQVPSVEILPASVTSSVTTDQIKKIASENAEKLRLFAEGEDGSFSVSSLAGAKSSSDSSFKPSSVSSGDNKVEIGVARLPEYQNESVEFERVPSSAGAEEPIFESDSYNEAPNATH